MGRTSRTRWDPLFLVLFFLTSEMTTIAQANIKSVTCVLEKTRVQGFCRSEEKCIAKCEKKHFQMGGLCLGKFWIKMCFCLKPCITPGGGSPKKVHVGEPSKKNSKPWNQPWVNTLVSPIVRRAFAHAPSKSPVKHTASSSSNGPVHPPVYAPVRPPAYAPVRPPARTPAEAVSD